MRSISMKTVEAKRAEILATLKDQTATHEQKVTYLARHAENFLTVLDEPEGLDELMRCEQGIAASAICLRAMRPIAPVTSARTIRNS